MSSESVGHGRQDAPQHVRTSTASGRHSFARASLLLAPSMAVATLLQYVLQVLAARTLPAGEFGGFGALLACTVVGSVSLLAVQAVVARRMSWSDDDGRRHSARALVVPAWWCGAGLMAVTVVAAPAIAAFLHVPILAVLLLAAGLAPLPLVGVGLGCVQGQRRTLVFASLYFAYAALRLLFVAAGLVLHPTTTVAMAGVALGALATALLAWRVVAAPAAAADPSLPERRLWLEVGRTALALLTVLALANVDLLMARHRLPPLASDRYALGSLAARAVFWLLQFAAVAAYADLSSRRAPRSRRTTLLAGLGVVVVLGAIGIALSAVVPTVVIATSVGASYAPVTAVLPLFTALGTALAATQYLLMGSVARGRSATGAVVAVGVFVEASALVLLRQPTVSAIAVVAAVVATLTAVLLLVLDLARLSGSGAPEPTAGGSVGGVVPGASDAHAHLKRRT